MRCKNGKKKSWVWQLEASYCTQHGKWIKLLLWEIANPRKLKNNRKEHRKEEKVNEKVFFLSFYVIFNFKWPAPTMDGWWCYTIFTFKLSMDKFIL